MNDPDTIFLEKIASWERPHPDKFNRGPVRLKYIVEKCEELKALIEAHRSHTLPPGSVLKIYLGSLTGSCPVGYAGDCSTCFLDSARSRTDGICALVRMRRIPFHVDSLSVPDLLKRINFFLNASIPHLKSLEKKKKRVKKRKRK